MWYITHAAPSPQRVITWNFDLHVITRRAFERTQERDAFLNLRFLFAGFTVRAWYWESVDLFQKLVLTSVIAFVAPRSSVQIIVAALFAFAMLLVTLQTQPYRTTSSNQLSALSQINIFLFLFTGLLLNTDPDGIAHNSVLFSALVGLLTTSIVGLSLFIFIRSLVRQTLRALYGADSDDEDEDGGSDDEEEAPPPAPLPGVEEADEAQLTAEDSAGKLAAKSSAPEPPQRSASPPAKGVRPLTAAQSHTRGEQLVSYVSGAQTPSGSPADSDWK